MKEYGVYLEINGNFEYVGAISSDPNGSYATFAYDPNYLGSENAAPISLSLPLQKDSFSAETTRSFFEGLLPEGFTRRTVAQHMQIDENDFISLLEGLGNECLGAIRISSNGETEEPGYEKLSTRQVKELAAEGAVRSADFVVRAHLSLTGASGKVGLYYDSINDAWYLPHGTAPSTHIVKQSHVRLDSIVTNEQLSMLTAAKCGLDVPKSFIIDTGNGRDQDVLFATARYDRRISDKCKYIGGFAVPDRLHQEDFAQAMGIPASKKYEAEGGQYMTRMFELLRKYSADPVDDTLKLWDAIVFNYFIGNTDAHIKNFSIIYSRDLKQICLAKFYDIVSTVIYDSSTRNMSFSIGGQYAVDEISEESFAAAARDIGLGEKLALERYLKMGERFRDALRQSASELSRKGFKNAERIASDIISKGGISRFGK